VCHCRYYKVSLASLFRNCRIKFTTSHHVKKVISTWTGSLKKLRDFASAGNLQKGVWRMNMPPDRRLYPVFEKSTAPPPNRNSSPHRLTANTMWHPPVIAGALERTGLWLYTGIRPYCNHFIAVSLTSTEPRVFPSNSRYSIHNSKVPQLCNGSKSRPRWYDTFDSERGKESNSDDVKSPDMLYIPPYITFKNSTHYPQSVPMAARSKT